MTHYSIRRISDKDRKPLRATTRARILACGLSRTHTCACVHCQRIGRALIKPRLRSSVPSAFCRLCACRTEQSNVCCHDSERMWRAFNNHAVRQRGSWGPSLSEKNWERGTVSVHPTISEPTWERGTASVHPAISEPTWERGIVSVGTSDIQ